MNIEGKITIKQVDKWGVDWENDSVKYTELKELRRDMEQVISEHCVMDLDKIYITLKLDD